MLLYVDAVLTGVDNVDTIAKISHAIVRALMTHVACVDCVDCVNCVDAAERETQVLRQGLSWR